MSIQKINIGGTDVEIEDVSARTNISNLTSEVNTVKGNVTTNTNNITSINNTIGSETLQTTSKTLKGAINEVKQSIGASGGGGGLPCIDTTRLLYEQSLIINDTVRYTATEDCIMCLSLGLLSGGTYININGTMVFYADSGASSTICSPSFMTLNLKKGDVFQYSPTANLTNRISFKVFGIRY